MESYSHEGILLLLDPNHMILYLKQTNKQIPVFIIDTIVDSRSNNSKFFYKNKPFEPGSGSTRL